jgi:hypothetical protein
LLFLGLPAPQKNPVQNCTFFVLSHTVLLGKNCSSQSAVKQEGFLNGFGEFAKNFLSIDPFLDRKEKKCVQMFLF